QQRAAARRSHRRQAHARARRIGRECTFSSYRATHQCAHSRKQRIYAPALPGRAAHATLVGGPHLHGGAGPRLLRREPVKYVLKTAVPSRPRFELERDLNVQQRAVVEAPAGRILVLAGAGTGKTRTLTYRMARWVLAGCRPERILLCTFTNRAAREMLGRIEGLRGLDMQRCPAGTFHHIGNRILRRYGEHVGLGSDFGILDPEDARILLASVIAELGLKVLSAKRFPQPKVLHDLVGLAAGTRVTLDELIREKMPQWVPQLPAILDV